MSLKEKGTFVSASGQELGCREWKPEGEPKGVVQIVHGMAEHIDRYDGVAEAMTEAGYIVVGHNHMGHGAETPLRGYFGKKDGWQNLEADVQILREETEKKYPGIPYFLLGHSMGSFVVRTYLTKHGEGLAGCVLSGTGYYSKNTARSGIQVAKLEVRRGKEKKESPLIDKIGFQTANKPFAPNRTNFDWLSRDEKEVDLYVADPCCGFLFTAGGYLAFFQGLEQMEDKEALSKIPPDLPILMISGEKDPIGQMGKGVSKVARNLLRAGQLDLSIRLYAGARHELFHELNRQEVFRDLTAWLDLKSRK